MIWRGTCAWAREAMAKNAASLRWGRRSVFVACRLGHRDDRPQNPMACPTEKTVLLILQSLHQRSAHGALGWPERGQQCRSQDHRRERQSDGERIGVSKIDPNQIAAGDFYAVVELDCSQAQT